MADENCQKLNASVVVVDDEEIILLMLEDFLKELGLKVNTFLSATKALKFYKNNWQSTDLLIIDMLMPEMNGKDLFTEMKKINPDAKCMISSGFSINKHVETMLNEGIIRYIPKPYRLNTLERIITEFLSSD